MLAGFEEWAMKLSVAVVQKSGGVGCCTRIDDERVFDD
jgi:hypothetical protein